MSTVKISLRQTKRAAACALMGVQLFGCGGSGGDGASTLAPVAAAPTGTTTPPGTVTPPTAPTNPTPPVGTVQANLVTAVPAFSGSADHVAAYTAINAARGTCGFGLLAQNGQLEVAAAKHSLYITSNLAAHPDAFAHIENAAYPNFYGAAPMDRSGLAGYSGVSTGEVIAGGGSTTTSEQDAVNVLLNAGYHLRILVGAGIYDMGTGTTTTSAGTSVSVIDVASKLSVFQEIGGADVATYPCAGLSIKASQYGIGRETPDPFPSRDYGAKPLGAPIYVRVRVGQTLVISSIVVTKAANSGAATNVPQAALFTAANDPNKELTANEALYYPDVPLTAGSYTVVITGTNNGAAFTKSFTFATTL